MIGFGPGGTIYVTGTAQAHFGGAWRMFAVRLLENGTVDGTFGKGGQVVTTPEPRYDEEGLVESLGQAGAVEPEGSVVIVGDQKIRLTPSGELDGNYPSKCAINALAMVRLPTGDLLLAGSQEGKPALERLLPNGAVDETFGDKGTTVLPSRPAATSYNEGNKPMTAIPLANGNILLAEGVAENAQGFAWLAELTPNGALEPSFGEGGTEYLPTDGYPPYVQLAQEPNGLIIVATEQHTGEKSRPILWALEANGKMDPHFGESGVAVVPSGEQPTAITTDSHGNIYAAAITGQSPPEPTAYLSELSPSGRINSAFGTSGVIELPQPSEIGVLTVDAQGRLLLAARAEKGDLLVERLLIGQQTESTSQTKPTTTGHTAHPKVIRGVITCKPTHKRKRREQCALSLSHLQGKWKAMTVTVTLDGHKIVKRLYKHIHMPNRLYFEVPKRHSILHWSVALRSGRVAAASGGQFRLP